MARKFIALFILFIMVSLTGCNIIPGKASNPSAQPSPSIVRESNLTTAWHMTQMEVTLEEGIADPILLKLAAGDKVDGYFYVENDKKINFNVMADSLVYESKPADNPSGKDVLADRFSFTASQALGTTYTLTFKNPTTNSKGDTKAQIFIEIIYPATATIFVPIPK